MQAYGCGGGGGSVYNVGNSYLAAIFKDGKMKEYRDGVRFEGSIPSLFRIPYSCTMQLLTDLVMKSLDFKSDKHVDKLYFRQPIMNENGLLMYRATELSCDEDVIYMLKCKPEFPINCIIELFVTFTRSPTQILELLERSQTSTDGRPMCIERCDLLIYFGGRLRRATVVECPYGHGLKFKSHAVVRMSMRHNITFVELVDKLSHGIRCGDRKVITEISYRRGVKVLNNKLYHDLVEIKCDTDITQMIQRWKDVQKIRRKVITPPTAGYIELFLQTKDIRPPTPEESYQDIKPWLYTTPSGGLGIKSMWDLNW